MLFYPNFTFANINIELRHNIPTSERSNIEQEKIEISRWVNRHSADQEAFQSKSVKLHYFCIFMYIYEDFSDFLWCFLFAEILQTLPLCQNCPICQSAKRARYYRQTSQILTKGLSVATVIIGALVCRGVPSHL